VKKLLANSNKILNYLCAVLLLVLLVTQFLPFWACDCKDCAGEDISISEYVWFPDDHKKGLTKTLKDTYDKDFELNDLVLTPIVILVAGAIGVVMCATKAHKAWVSILPIIAGGMGVIGYLSDPVLQMGNNWVLHLLAAAVVLIVGLIACVLNIIKLVKDKLEEWSKLPG